MAEVAELASREVANAEDSSGKHQSVFFLQTVAGTRQSGSVPILRRRLSPAIEKLRLVPGEPGAVHVQGWEKAFRVVYKHRGSAGGLYLGFDNVSGAEMLDRLTERCLLAWAGTVAWDSSLPGWPRIAR